MAKTTSGFNSDHTQSDNTHMVCC